jgi:hypothetical protein
MSDSPDKNAVVIAGLLDKLADLSAEDAALAAYRRESDLFDPALSTAAIAIDLLAIETEPAGRKEIRGFIRQLLKQFQEQGELAAVGRIIEGMEKIDGAEPRS